MTNQQLFLNLIHSLKRYDDAVVLYVCLQQSADVAEFKTTATSIAFDRLDGQIGKKQVQRSLERLSDVGLIELRVHANYRTHIRVNYEAVHVLVGQLVNSYLPGLRDEVFPFLQAQEADALRDFEQDACEVIKKVAQPPKPSPDQSSPDRPAPDESSAA